MGVIVNSVKDVTNSVGIPRTPKAPCGPYEPDSKGTIGEETLSNIN